MSSLRKILAAQANGRRSLGPVTPEGKSRSASNAVTHGLLAQFVLMEDESPEAFRDLIDEHLRLFQPTNGVEAGFIEQMAAATSRIRRAWAMQTRMLDNEAAALKTEDRLDRISAAHSAPAAQQSLDHLLRYETRLDMMYQRAFHNLLLVRALVLPNEPNPISEQCDTVDLPVLPAPEEQEN